MRFGLNVGYSGARVAIDINLIRRPIGSAFRIPCGRRRRTAPTR